MKLNKKRLGVTLGLLLVLVLVITFTFKKSTATTEHTILKEQNIEGITFDNAEIKKDVDGYIFSVSIYNENTEKVDISSLTIKFKKDEEKDINIKLDDVNSLDAFEGRKIEIKTDKSLENIDEIEYVIKRK